MYRSMLIVLVLGSPVLALAGPETESNLLERMTALYVIARDDHTIEYVVDNGRRDRVAEFPPPRLQDDPDLEAGFPVSAYHSGGSFHAGQAIHAMVMDLDADLELEIVATGVARGPVYGWNHDGSLMPGWPLPDSSAGYHAAGLVVSRKQMGVALGYWNGEMAVYDASGAVQPGWPRTAANRVATPPSVAHALLANEGQIFIEEEDWMLHGYARDGTTLGGWPVVGGGGQERHTPAVGDIDGDEALEILSCSGPTTSGVYLFAYNGDGTSVAGFPVNIEPQGFGAADAFPAIGELDGTDGVEILVANRHNEVRVYGGDGTLEMVLPYAGTVSYSTAAALADLNGDGLVEVVVQANQVLNVIEKDGSPYPGWPVDLGGAWWQGNSSPVVGDVDGDGDQDIVVTVQQEGSQTVGELRAYDRTGSMLVSFPKSLPIGAGAVPAIADIDLDGRNEIVVVGSYWAGIPGEYPKCWAFDLHGGGYGRIEWGQFMHDAAHTGNHGDDVLARVAPAEASPDDGRVSGLMRVHPNPSRAGFKIAIRPGIDPESQIGIYDLQGRMVRVLDAGPDPIWDARDRGGMLVPPGLYLLRAGAAHTRAVVVR